MSRSRTVKKVMAYFYMPLLFCIIGYGVLYFALSPVLSPLISSLSLVVSDTPPDYSSHINTIFEGKPQENQPTGQDTVDESLVEMPVYGTHYANLEIASVSISTDLYFGDSSAVLKRGVGQYIGSSIPGYGKPLLIGGHNNAAFHRLQNVQAGDIVTITTNYGVYEYQITETRIAAANDKSAYDLSQKEEQLILYTCYPFDTLGLTSKRFFVYADKVSGPVIVSGSAG